MSLVVRAERGSLHCSAVVRAFAWRCTLAFLVLPWAACPLAGQQLSGQLTLEDALRLAGEHNPTLRKAANDGPVHDVQLRQAWAAFLPDISAFLGFGAGSSRSITGQDDFGRPVTLPEPRSFQSSRASQGVSATLTLFDGTANLRNLGARKAEARATDHGYEAARIAVEAQVSRAYFAAVGAARGVALEEQLLASAQDRVARTEQLLRLAANDQTDVLGARADAAMQEQKLEQARAAARKSKITLLESIGLEATSDLELAGELPDVFDPATLSADSLVAVATAHNPLIAQREALQLAAERRASAARGARLPRVGLSGSYGRSMSVSSYQALGELNPQNSAFDVSLSVSLPLFTRFATSVQIAQAEAQEADAREDSRQARLQIAAAVLGACIDLQNAFRALELAALSARLGQERLDLAQEKYRMGALGFTELQNVIDRTAQARRDALDARFGFISARIALEEKLGTRLAS
jgi:outer membrane protein